MIELVSTNEVFCVTGAKGITALMRLAAGLHRGDDVTVQTLLEMETRGGKQSEAVKLVDEFGWSALHYASAPIDPLDKEGLNPRAVLEIEGRKRRIGNALVQYGADDALPNNEGITPQQLMSSPGLPLVNGRVDYTASL